MSKTLSFADLGYQTMGVRSGGWQRLDQIRKHNIVLTVLLLHYKTSIIILSTKTNFDFVFKNKFKAQQNNNVNKEEFVKKWES